MRRFLLVEAPIVLLVAGVLSVLVGALAMSRAGSSAAISLPGAVVTDASPFARDPAP